MFLLSRNGPLGAIWVAAYFFKKLKRSQITQFHISSSVDKILQVEFDVVTYRVLAYLLLGVVRVFSKKVEYLYNDCNKVLLKIKDFMVTNKDSTQLETQSAPYFSITVPERFELDAFDLEILEDTIGGHVLPREDITLKESMPKILTSFLHTLDEHLCEELATCDICFSPQNMNEDVLSSQKSKFNVRVGTSPNLRNLEASKEKHQGDESSLHESVDHDMSLNPCTEKHHSETRILEVVCLDETHEESSMQELWSKSICEEALLNLSMFSEFGQIDKNPVKLPCEHNQNSAEKTEIADEVHLRVEDNQIMEENCNNTTDDQIIEHSVKLSCEHHQSNAEATQVQDEAQLQVENHQILEEDCDDINDQIVEEYSDLTIPEASMEKRRDNIDSHDENRDFEMFDLAKEPPEHSRAFDEEHQKNTEQDTILKVEEPSENTRLFGDKSSSDMTPSGNRIYEILTEDNSLSLALDSTPRSKFQDASGIGTPEFLGIPTPVGKEAPRVSRKRKCLLDDVIVFPNKLVRQCIEDSSHLVCRRKKVPRTALAAWRVHRVYNLPRCFQEPLIPYTSPELASIFCRKKLNLKLRGKSVSRCPTASSSVEDVKFIRKLDDSKACNDGKSSENMNSVDGLNELSFQAVQSPPNIDIVQSLGVRSLEQTAIAPETPVQRTKSLRSFQTPERPEISGVGLWSGTVEKELSPEEQDFDIGLVNEDENSSEGDSQDQNGLSARTRVVMRYLNRCFLNRKKQREDEVVNLMVLLKGRTKKRSAMLFYEILLLKSKGYVEVKQESACDEIFVWKSSRWE